MSKGSSSSSCQPCGFEPGTHLLRGVDDARVVAELEGANHSGSHGQHQLEGHFLQGERERARERERQRESTSGQWVKVELHILLEEATVM